MGAPCHSQNLLQVLVNVQSQSSYVLDRDDADDTHDNHVTFLLNIIPEASLVPC